MSGNLKPLTEEEQATLDQKVLAWAFRRLRRAVRDQPEHLDLSRTLQLNLNEWGNLGKALDNRRKLPSKAFGSYSFRETEVVDYLIEKLVSKK